MAIALAARRPRDASLDVRLALGLMICATGMIVLTGLAADAARTV